MKNCRGKGCWYPFAGAVVAGLWACNTGLFGAPPSSVERTAPGSGNGVAAPSLSQVPIAPPVHAYRLQTVLQREGGADIALSIAGEPRQAVGSVADGAIVCIRNSDCDDCDPCTADVCVIPPTQFQGNCTNAPAPTCGLCSDGDFCNGAELCNADGQCRSAAAGPCASRPNTICDERGGATQTGECLTPCKVASDCDDSSMCSGVEVCVLRECIGGDNAGAACSDDTPCTGIGGYCGGVCRSLGLPCGSIAGCTEPVTCGAGTCNQTTGRCVGGTNNGDACVNEECTLFGRCCVAGVCSRKTKPDCDTAGGLWLAAGDDAGTPGTDEATCNNLAGPTRPNAGEGFNCPGYGAGVVPEDIGAAVGFVGAAACNPMQELGDDYNIAGCGAGQYFKVTTVRWIGGFLTDGIEDDPSRYRLTFRDASGQFIEDTVTNPTGIGTVSRRTVIFGETPTIPCSGFVSIRAATQFSPFAKFNWATANSVQTGTNDADILLVNGTPQNLLGAGNNRLAFELVGEIVDAPNGACCNSTSGICTRELPWVCDIQGNYFQGIGTFCQACNNNLLRSCTVPADCPACVGGGNPGDSCDVNAQCLGGSCLAGTCSGGTNNGNACDPNFDCTSGGTCTGTAACDAVPPACTLTACCDNATGACSEIQAPSSCPAGTTSLGFGTTCDPDCCLQFLTPLNTGYDTCADASAAGHLVSFVASPTPGDPTQAQMPAPGDPPVTVTFSGNNSTSTFGDAVPGGTCEFTMFTQGGGTDDRGWWHAFSTSACSNVRIDFCCTAERSGEVKQPQWANLWAACNPCGTTISSAVVGDASVGGVGMLTDSNNRGAPFCNSDDLWETYGPLEAGTYWVPVYSAPAGTFGDYQMHVTVGACPLAACCLKSSLCTNADRSLVFDGGGAVVACTGTVGTQGSCAAGQTCSLCSESNVLDCRAADGFWNGFGNIPFGQDPIATCDFGTCEYGSCCLGAGNCKEGRQEPTTACNRSDPVTTQCYDLASCNTDGGTFSGEVTCDNPTPPCPACEFIGPGNCQLPITPNDGYMYMSDLSASGSNGIVSADDFIPADTTLSKVCVWGLYLDVSVPEVPGPRYDCTPGSAANDQFRIRVLNDNGGIPGTLLGQSTVTGANIAFGPEPTTNTPRVFAWWGSTVRGYTLTLDTPIAGMTPGTTYWLEVANATYVPQGECNWHWMMVRPDAAVREAYAASGISPGASQGDILAGSSIYVRGSERAGVDLGFCLSGPNGPLNFESPTPPLGCCWQCDHTNAITTPLDCMPNSVSPGTWNGGDPTCAGLEPEFLNDTCQRPLLGSAAGGICGNSIVEAGEQCDDGGRCTDTSGCVVGGAPCADASTCVPVPDDGCDELCQLECEPPVGPPGIGPLVIKNGLFNFDTACSTSDGPTAAQTRDAGSIPFSSDIWYEYKATCTGFLVVDQCATQTAETQLGRSATDAALAIYHDYQGDPFTCPCPGLYQGVSPLQVDGGDDNCNGYYGSSGYLRVLTFKNECWLIRAGGWEGAKGRGLISVSCEQVTCFPSSAPQPAPIQNAVGATVAMQNNRFLSFQGGDAGKQQAVRVKFVSLPPPWTAWNGTTMYVGAPFLSSELPGKAIDDPSPPTFKAARLECAPVFRDWTLEGIVHVFHEGIIPSKLAPGGGSIAIPAVYDIQFIESTCNAAAEASFGAPLTITNAGWGDVAALVAGQYRANDNKVEVTADVLAVLAKFGNAAGAPIKPRAEVVGSGPSGPIGPLSGKVEISDVLAVLGAFSGASYPFGPPAGLPPCSLSSVAGR